MQRKTFLWLSTVSAASFFIPSGCNSRYTLSNKAVAQPQFLLHICDEKTVRTIGAMYKKQTPGESEGRKLASLILTDNAGHAIPESTDAATLQTALNQKIARDFETGRTVVVEGWVLSQTEARQCALLSLQA